jgi:hypothetical protein
MSVDNDTQGWQKLDVSVLQSGDGSEIPFRLVANRFKSSSPDSELFIHDPLTALLKAQDDGVLDLDGIRLTPEWTVVTLVTNHHQTLSATHLYATVTADSSEQQVTINLVKKPNR